MSGIDSKVLQQHFPTDIRPTDTVPIVEMTESGLQISLCKWGYPLAKGKNLVINARVESVLDKPSFRNGILHHRVLIPASGFYEWNRMKEKSSFTKPDVSILYMAGFYDWFENERMLASDLKGHYDYVTGKLDELLAKHGYVRDGHCYKVVESNEDTLVFFCHFGLECVLLSHLLNISPMVLWHGVCAAPSSVTTLNTEERREGIAAFRMSAFGDISHLYVHDEAPAFAARFCETYGNTEERHD